MEQKLAALLEYYNQNKTLFAEQKNVFRAIVDSNQNYFYEKIKEKFEYLVEKEEIDENAIEKLFN